MARRAPRLRRLGWREIVHTFLARCDGASSVIVAVSFTALLASAAAAIDLGDIFLGGRQLQGMADLAAISAAQDPTNAEAAAQATVAANRWSQPVSTQAVIGVYNADPTLGAAARFQPTAVDPSAAQVTLTSQIPLVFAGVLFGRSSLSITRVGTAARAEFASFSVGSGLVALQSGVANALLSALTGGQVQLSVMDYNALVGANFDLFQYMSALKTRAGLQGASFNTVLNAPVSTSTALAALADVLGAEGQITAAAAATTLAGASGGAAPVKLGGLFNLGPYGSQDHVSTSGGAGISVAAMDFVDGALALSNGQRQVALDLGASLPGLADVKVWLAIGQRPAQSPWLTVTDDGGVVVSTAQARLYVDAHLLGAPPVLAGLPGVSVDVPLYLQLASAQAKLTGLQCTAAGQPQSVDLSANPSVGQLALGQVNPAALNDFSTAITPSTATLVQAAIVTVTGSAQIDVGGQDWQPVDFTAADIAAGTQKTVSTTNVASASVASLLQNTQLGVQVAGLGLGLDTGAVSQGVQGALIGAAGSLDQTLDTLEALTGLRLGEAVVRVDGLRCNGAALVG